MIERAFPTVNGIAVSPLDIWLPTSELNLNKDKSFNNHHGEWTAKKFGRSILYQVLRDLSSNQIYLPLDVHEWIHATYCPPEMPEPYEAMERIEQAYWENEQLHIKKAGGYVLRHLDKAIYQQCDEDYTRLR